MHGGVFCKLGERKHHVEKMIGGLLEVCRGFVAGLLEVCWRFAGGP